MELESSLPHSQVQPPVPILSQLHPVHTPTSHFLKHLGVLTFTPGSSRSSLSLRFPHQKPASASLLPHTCYMPRPYHSSRYDQTNNNWWAVQIINLLVLYFSPLPCYLVPLNTNILRRSLISNTLSWSSSLNVSDQLANGKKKWLCLDLIYNCF